MADENDVISTGDLCRAVGVTLTAAQIRELGFTPQALPRAGTFWRRADVRSISERIVEKVRAGAAAVEAQGR